MCDCDEDRYCEACRARYEELERRRLESLRTPEERD
jgi:hypothetical protein